MAASQKGPRPRALADRLWAKVEQGGADECWPWQGSRNPEGYGKIGVGSRTLGTRRSVYAHRTVWELEHGPVPDGLHVLHSCDNPPCCNPAHLWLGTNADNQADRHAKGRDPGSGFRRVFV